MSIVCLLIVFYCRIVVAIALRASYIGCSSKELVEAEADCHDVFFAILLADVEIRSDFCHMIILRMRFYHNVDPGNLKKTNLHLFSSTLKNCIITTKHHKNTNLAWN